MKKLYGNNLYENNLKKDFQIWKKVKAISILNMDRKKKKNVIIWHEQNINIKGVVDMII